MINSKTVFIIGAGASAEFKLPVGSKLKSLLASSLNITFEDFGQLRSGDTDVVNALRACSREMGEPSGNINRFIPSLRALSRSMPLSISIDNYLNDHRTDKEAIIGAKIAIAKIILREEHNSVLAGDKSDGINFSKMPENWLSNVFNVVQEGIESSEVEKIFDNVSFICFNYDRCIERFLQQALKLYYRLTDEISDELVEKIGIVHPYGQVGSIHRPQFNDSVQFGNIVDPENLFKISKSIKTFTEAIDEGIIEQIKCVLSNCQRIVFLGFGFHDQNMELLTRVEGSNVVDVVATVSGISDQDLPFVERAICKAFPSVRRSDDTLHMAHMYASALVGSARKRLQS